MSSLKHRHTELKMSKLLGYQIGAVAVHQVIINIMQENMANILYNLVTFCPKLL